VAIHTEYLYSIYKTAQLCCVGGRFRCHRRNSELVSKSSPQPRFADPVAPLPSSQHGYQPGRDRQGASRLRHRLPHFPTKRGRSAGVASAALCCRFSPPHAPLAPSHQAFVAHYYQAFDAEATRPSLAALYQPQSMLSFEGSQLMVRYHARVPLVTTPSAHVQAAQLARGWRKAQSTRHFLLLVQGRQVQQPLTQFFSWGASAQGGEAIMQKLCSLQFKSCQHKARRGGGGGGAPTPFLVNPPR
jgi:hypothetical protein